ERQPRLLLAVGCDLALERHPRGGGLDEKHTDLSGARARRDEHRGGEMRGRDAVLHPVEAPAGPVAYRAGHRRRRILRRQLDQPRGEDRLARRDRCQPALALRIGAELGERQPRGPGGHRRSNLLEQETELRQAEAAAARALRQSHAEQVRLGERGPQLAVEPVAVALDQLQPLVRGVILTDRARQLAQRFLLRGECEVHQRDLGIPRPPMAMISRCTSFVPAPKVMMSVARYMRSSRPRSSAAGEPAFTYPAWPSTSSSRRYAVT